MNVIDMWQILTQHQHEFLLSQDVMDVFANGQPPLELSTQGVRVMKALSTKSPREDHSAMNKRNDDTKSV